MNSVWYNRHIMGFPTWTLWGMGLSAFGALLTITLAYIAQSPNLLIRFRTIGPRLGRQARTYTGASVALLLLGMGFFLAGVPLGSPTAANNAMTAAPETNLLNPSVEAQSNTEQDALALTVESAELVDTAVIPAVTNVPAQPTSITPESGSFGLPSTNDDNSIEDTTEQENISSQPSATSTIVNTPTNTPTTAPTNTPTPSPTATSTPIPTITPTAISETTAIINAVSSNVWIRRSPGGQQFILLANGSTVIPTNGRANQDGIVWREVRTVRGETGWIPADLLQFEEDGR